MKRLLPFTCNVKLTSYPYLADYLSILESNGHDCTGIIFNNYIELFYKPWKGQIRFLNHLSLKSNLEITKFHYPLSCPIDFVIENINHNRYVIIVLKLDNIILNGRNQVFNMHHNWLLYGYDSNKKIFNVAGYVSINGLNRYENFELSFSDFLLSLPQSDEETNYQTNIMFNHLCSIKKAYSPEKINIEKIKHSIKRFVYKFPPLFYNGNIYSRLIFHIKLFSRSSFIPHNRSLLDMRDFRTLYENKLIISEIINLFSTNKEIINGYKEVKSKTFSILLLVTRYNNNLSIEKKIKIQRIVVERLKIIKKKDQYVLKKFLKEL